MPLDARQTHLQRLQQHRAPKETVGTLAFMKDQFKREVEKPHKQLGKITELWAELVPPDLAGHTRLEGLTRGTLRVAVGSSAHLYELDRLLRSGLERQLITRHTTGSLRRVQLRVG